VDTNELTYQTKTERQGKEEMKGSESVGQRETGRQRERESGSGEHATPARHTFLVRAHEEYEKAMKQQVRSKMSIQKRRGVPKKQGG